MTEQTVAETKTIEDAWLAKARNSGVPEHLRHGLMLYITRRVPPGSFLLAVLENNLSEAMGRADESSRAGLFQLVAFIYNDVPSVAWGSPSKVNNWLKAAGR